jgi:hypothetical protein
VRPARCPTWRHGGGCGSCSAWPPSGGGRLPNRAAVIDDSVRLGRHLPRASADGQKGPSGTAAWRRLALTTSSITTISARPALALTARADVPRRADSFDRGPRPARRQTAAPARARHPVRRAVGCSARRPAVTCGPARPLASERSRLPDGHRMLTIGRLRSLRMVHATVGIRARDPVRRAVGCSAWRRPVTCGTARPLAGERGRRLTVTGR